MVLQAQKWDHIVQSSAPPFLLLSYHCCVGEFVRLGFGAKREHDEVYKGCFLKR